MASRYRLPCFIPKTTRSYSYTARENNQHPMFKPVLIEVSSPEHTILGLPPNMLACSAMTPVQEMEKLVLDLRQGSMLPEEKIIITPLPSPHSQGSMLLLSPSPTSASHLPFCCCTIPTAPADCPGRSIKLPKRLGSKGSLTS